MRSFFTQIRADLNWFGLCKEQVVSIAGFLFFMVINPMCSLAQSSIYTTTGTHSFTVPANVTAISVECWGGGGAGGGVGTVVDDAGGGGGGGAYVKSIITVTPGMLFTLNVGAGGIGRQNLPGDDGGQSGQRQPPSKRCARVSTNDVGCRSSDATRHSRCGWCIWTNGRSCSVPKHDAGGECGQTGCTKRA